MTTVTRKSTTLIAAEPEEVWTELDANFVGISAWAGGVRSSVTNPATPTGLNGSAHGGRICDIDGIGVTDERIIRFDAEVRSLSYSIQSEGLPFFVTGLQNTWTVRSDVNGGSAVDIEMSATTKGVLGAVGAIPLGRMLGKAAVGLPGDLKAYLEPPAQV